MFFRILTALFVLSFAYPPMVGAIDMISWNSAQNITGDSDVTTNGALVYAYSIGFTNVVNAQVNGVHFVPWAIPNNNSTSSNIGSARITETPAPGYLISYDTMGTSSGAFKTLSAQYQLLMQSCISSTSGGTLSLTVGGLTVGNSYQIQLWANNSALLADTPTQTTATATGSVVLNTNVSSTYGALGQYVIGTFVATSTSSVISLTGGGTSNKPMINAFQLRDITPVPEPSTYVFATIATCILASIARRPTHRAARV